MTADIDKCFGLNGHITWTTSRPSMSSAIEGCVPNSSFFRCSLINLASFFSLGSFFNTSRLVLNLGFRLFWKRSCYWLTIFSLLFSLWFFLLFLMISAGLSLWLGCFWIIWSCLCHCILSLFSFYLDRLYSRLLFICISRLNWNSQ